MRFSRHIALLLGLAFLLPLLGVVLTGCQDDSKAPTKTEMDQTKPVRKKKGEV